MRPASRSGIYFERGGQISYTDLDVPMTDDRWRSPLGTRYASPAMQRLWGEPHRIGLWRRLWLALAEAERELGLDIPEAALAEMRAHLDDIDFEAAARVRAAVPARRDGPRPRLRRRGARGAAVHPPRRHQRVRHRQRRPPPDARGARAAARPPRSAVLEPLRGVRRAARRACPAWPTPTSSRRSSPPSGKRATLWMQDLVLDLAELDHRLGDAAPAAAARARPARRRPSSSSSSGDHAKVRELDRRVAAKLGLPRVYAGDRPDLLRASSTRRCSTSLAASPQSRRSSPADLRLLQHEGEIEEPFESRADRLLRDGLQAQPDARRADRVARALRDVAWRPTPSRPRRSSGLSGRSTTAPTGGWRCPRRSWRPTRS